MRVTMKDLENMLDRINHIKPNHELDGAYGGWKLGWKGINNDSFSDVLNIGFTTKTYLYRNMWSYLIGLGE